MGLGVRFRPIDDLFALHFVAGCSLGFGFPVVLPHSVAGFFLGSGTYLAQSLVLGHAFIGFLHPSNLLYIHATLHQFGDDLRLGSASFVFFHDELQHLAVCHCRLGLCVDQAKCREEHKEKESFHLRCWIVLLSVARLCLVEVSPRGH